ncbi:G-type lectin S-receptor-like serine/threonine-protein kinase At4g27290 [Olea europaea var. sylvestris]|uniref:G-type lectin S-receptor-like serine/threonine-protein kinase At4g27290 n=1 Tax=Olea europaea var. sylvestris TaxID=158386 RepID=UPI000C1CFCB4|nr:G-type lectin S-receptor-like serine/threonine-protein kinase At4g27290 [Olea europaea var. sylvestris]
MCLRESFNYPTDTIFSGTKFGWNFRTGQEAYLSSWKSNDDPSLGDFTYHFDPTGYPQHVLKKGLLVLFKSGPWNELCYSGKPNMKYNPIYIYGLVLNKNEAYFSFELLNRSIISRFTLSESGVRQRITWINRTRVGDRFQPKDPERWQNADLSNGFDGRTPLNCQNGAVFFKNSGGSGCLLWFQDLVNIKDEYD